MQPASKFALLALVLAACVGTISAGCPDLEYMKEETIEIEFDNVYMNKLKGFHVMSGGYSQPTIVMYSDKPLEEAKEYIAINQDMQKGNLMLDAVGDEKPCMELYIPYGDDFKEIKLEGSAEAILGNFTFSDFVVTVSNGKLSGSDHLEAESLDLNVKGSGVIDLQPSGGSVVALTTTISGGGNITFLGVAENADVNNVGMGFTYLGKVMDSMDVSLAGQGNTTVIGSPDLKVRGVSQPPCYITVMQGECDVTSEDTNFEPCIEPASDA